MNADVFAPAKMYARRVLAALTLTAACASAWALPAFTLNPSAAGLAGDPVNADNIIVSSFAHVTLGSGGTFTESGLLSVQGFQSLGSVASAPGLNQGYGLYFSFEGAGVQTSGGSPLSGVTTASFTSLDFTLYGYNGSTASFAFDGSNNPTITAVAPIALATGKLVPGQGSVVTIPLGGSFVPSATATVTFAPVPGREAFFASPTSFYTSAFSAFTNTLSTVELISANEFRIRQGGGTFNFAAAPVPEPETYALFLAGLGAVGYVVRRRRNA